MRLSSLLRVAPGRGLSLRLEAASEFSAFLASPLAARLRDLGLLPLLVYLGKAAPWWEEVPTGEQEQMEHALARGRALGLRIAGGMEMLSAILRRAHLPCLLMKGGDLAFHVYPAPGLRDMLDVDILVPRDRLEECGRLLRSEGFGENHDYYSREWCVNCKSQLPSMTHPMGFTVDVHATLLPSYSPFNLPPMEPWQGTAPSQWPGVERMSREVMAWHLMSHAFISHSPSAGARERFWVDLLAMAGRAQQEPLDWRRVLELATLSGSHAYLSQALFGLARFQGLEFLDQWARRSQDLARINRWDERGRLARDRLRWMAPFLGSGHPWPPDAWRQFLRRPWRVGGQLARRGLGLKRQSQVEGP